MENFEELLNETVKKVNLIKYKCSGKQEGEIEQEMKQIEMDLCDALSNYGVEYGILRNIEGRFYDLTRNLLDGNRKTIEEIVLEANGKITANFSSVMESAGIEEEQEGMRNNAFSKTRKDVEIMKQEKKQVQTLPMQEYVKETYTRILENVIMQQFGRSADEIAQTKYIIESSYQKCIQTTAERQDRSRNEVTQMIQDEVENLDQDVKRMTSEEKGDSTQEGPDDEKSKIENLLNEVTEVVQNNKLIEMVETMQNAGKDEEIENLSNALQLVSDSLHSISSELEKIEQNKIEEMKPNVEDTKREKKLPSSLDAYVLSGENLEQFNKKAIKLAEEYKNQDEKTDKGSEMDIENLFN